MSPPAKVIPIRTRGSAAGGSDDAGAPRHRVDASNRRLDERSDEELLFLACGGVVEAFAELVRRWERPVRSYCAKWCGARGDDIAQEAFHDVWRARATYQPSGRFAAYLFTIVRNRCRNERRAQGLRDASPDRGAPLGAGDRPDQLDAIVAAEERRRIHAELVALPRPLREAVMLRFDGELDYREIAKVVKAKESTVRSRVFLAVARLRKALREVDR
jgi:RNA polymerase sigma-70 factor (ECF subfamily)